MMWRLLPNVFTGALCKGPSLLPNVVKIARSIEPVDFA